MHVHSIKENVIAQDKSIVAYSNNVLTNEKATHKLASKEMNMKNEIN